MTKPKRTTGIEWTEHTWNPFIGCSVISPGCTNCYAMKQAARCCEFSANSVYHGTVSVGRHPVWTGKLRRASAQTFRKPLKHKSPAMFFVNSMSDFFHESAPDQWRLDALAIMADTPHIYQVLTKRPELIAPFLARTNVALPRNLWLGVTVERGDYTYRIDLLRDIAAEVRFISFEPLIGPVGEVDLSGVHWIITGGESGPGARPMRFDWLADIHEQAQAQNVACFFKQYGKPENNPLWHEAVRAGKKPRRYIQQRDPGKKGGCLFQGAELKQYPAFEIQEPLRA